MAVSVEKKESTELLNKLGSSVRGELKFTSRRNSYYLTSETFPTRVSFMFLCFSFKQTLFFFPRALVKLD